VPAPPLKKAEEQVRARLEKEKRVKGRVGREKAKEFSNGYNDQPCYLVQLYDPAIRAPVGVIPVRTLPTLNGVLEGLKSRNLYPLMLPQPVYIPQRFWELYRKASKGEKAALAKEFGLLRDESIYRFETVVIDIDSPFESVYPAWEKLKERLSLKLGYQVYRTKSGRFRAYIYLLDGTKDLKRAKELVAIIYAYFEAKGLNSDATFVHRLNHPVFYEDFPLYDYRLVEEEEGRIHFFKLYRSVKKLQRELGLYTFKGRNLTEEIWVKKPPVKKKKSCRLIKVPAFVRRLREDVLDNLELWKEAVISLFRKHGSYRYTYVIQPAVGWAKWLELPEEEVTEFLVGLLGEKKGKDVEKAWRYARELEFVVPERTVWLDKTREEWEGEVIGYLRFRRRAYRQELLKKVFKNQVWLLEEILGRMEREGRLRSYFEKRGVGRPRKVYEVAEEFVQPLRKVVGSEWTLQELISGQSPVLVSNTKLSCCRKEFSLFNNNSLFERAMGGGWKGGVYTGITVNNAVGSSRIGGNFVSRGDELKSVPSGSPASSFDEFVFKKLCEGRFSFDLYELSGKKRRSVRALSFSSSDKTLRLSTGVMVPLSRLARLNFKGREAVRFYKEIVPYLPEGGCLGSFVGKTIYVYPYAAPPERWELVRCGPYFFVLHGVEYVKSGAGKPRRVHSYSLLFKIATSAYTLFRPYRSELIALGEPLMPHEAGKWREASKEVTWLMLEEFKKRRKRALLVTLALKDGREITGVLRKRGGCSGFYYTLLDPENRREKIFVFKHAVDDFWVGG